MWRIFLFPFALLFKIVVLVRHWLFDLGILKSVEFPLPVISVGNLTMGGTGKTPHIEYLVNLLLPDYNIAILSRGYKRKTNSFIIANQYSTSEDIGDEPLQYVKKYSNKITVAVDTNRVNGITNLMQNDKELDVVLLDDAFQHRYVKPGLSILLTDYRNLYVNDYFFPVGTLRDTVSAAKRADIVIVTKTDKVLSPIVRKNIRKKLNIMGHQNLYFSYLVHENCKPFPGFELPEISEKKYSAIIMFAGIANTYPMKEHLRDRCSELIALEFPDHHKYRKQDVELIKKTFDNQFTRKKIIVTTEKDVMRLINSPYLRLLKDLPLYYLPVKVKFHGLDETNFKNQIKKYVRENKRNN